MCHKGGELRSFISRKMHRGIKNLHFTTESLKCVFEDILDDEMACDDKVIAYSRQKFLGYNYDDSYSVVTRSEVTEFRDIRALFH